MLVVIAVVIVRWDVMVVKVGWLNGDFDANWPLLVDWEGNMLLMDHRSVDGNMNVIWDGLLDHIRLVHDDLNGGWDGHLRTFI